MKLVFMYMYMVYVLVCMHMYIDGIDKTQLMLVVCCEHIEQLY